MVWFEGRCPTWGALPSWMACRTWRVIMFWAFAVKTMAESIAKSTKMVLPAFRIKGCLLLSSLGNLGFATDLRSSHFRGGKTKCP
jgi:hypothetical protein